MNNLPDMIWIELRKAVRSRLPLWTALGSLFLPFGIAFLIFVSRNPEISQRLGVVSAKANLVAFSSTDWPAYLEALDQMIALGGFILFVLAASWVFGREFVDGTLKDLLAVPIERSNILLAKFILVALWSLGLAVLIFLTGLIMGAAIGIPGGSPGIIIQASGRVAITACLMIAVGTPFALLASLGRGYLLPMGLAILMVLMGNLASALGWGEYFPWIIPVVFAQGKTTLSPVSYWIVAMTGLAGIYATYLWWKNADQSR